MSCLKTITKLCRFYSPLILSLLKLENKKSYLIKFSTLILILNILPLSKQSYACTKINYIEGKSNYSINFPQNKIFEMAHSTGGKMYQILDKGSKVLLWNRDYIEESKIYFYTPDNYVVFNDGNSKKLVQIFYQNKLIQTFDWKFFYFDLLEKNLSSQFRRHHCSHIEKIYYWINKLMIFQDNYIILESSNNKQLHINILNGDYQIFNCTNSNNCFKKSLACRNLKLSYQFQTPLYAHNSKILKYITKNNYIIKNISISNDNNAIKSVSTRVRVISKDDSENQTNGYIPNSLLKCNGN